MRLAKSVEKCSARQTCLPGKRLCKKVGINSVNTVIVLLLCNMPGQKEETLCKCVISKIIFYS